MPARRAALLATAAVCAIAAPSPAWASWTTTSPGTAAANAGTFTAPTPSLGTISCSANGNGSGNGNITVTVRVSWSLTTGAAFYDVQADNSPPVNQTPVTAASPATSTSVSFTAKAGQTSYARLRVRAGNWFSAYTSATPETISCPP